MDVQLNSRKLSVSLLFLGMLLSSVAASGDGVEKEDTRVRNIISYSVSNRSWLSLRGTTNVNSFECLSASPDLRGYVLTDAGLNDNRVEFTGANIMVNIESFDCKNALLTRDMHNALGSECNSGIEIKLLDALIGETNWYSPDGNILANILITINGLSKTKELNIGWRRQGLEYSFEGTADISMIDFNIDPPSPVMGLVKVNDKITVNFIYSVRSEEISRLD